MRIVVIAIAASCAALAQPTLSQIQVCDVGGKCQSFAKPEDADRYVQSIDAARTKQARDTERAMPIDYRDCIVPALLDEMAPDKAHTPYAIFIHLHRGNQAGMGRGELREYADIAKDSNSQRHLRCRTLRASASRRRFHNRHWPVPWPVEDDEG
jgi:hypothetical protein